jgi:DnaK suppressor DksA-like protein
MNEHEEIAKVLKARHSELRTHLAKVDRSSRKPLPADSEDQAIELENQEALEVIEKTETREIHQPNDSTVRGGVPQDKKGFPSPSP